MFDSLLIINLFLIASLLVCLLTSRLTINIKHFSLFSQILTDFVKFRFTTPPPPIYFDSPCLLNLTKISDPPSLFIRQLRVNALPNKSGNPESLK